MSELDEILDAFLEETNDLLTRAEDLLLVLESNPKDLEALNGLFRSIHTIKGSAGMFGFDWIVEFTHVIENLLEKLRSYQLELSPTLIEILLQSKDYILDIVQIQAKGTIDPEVKERGRSILKNLETYLSSLSLSSSGKPYSAKDHDSTDPSKSSVQSIINSHLPDDIVSDSHPDAQQNPIGFNNPHYHISIRMNHNSFLNALDPQSFIRYLNQLGKILFVRTIIQSIPSWKEFDPENCYLGFEISFSSDKSLFDVKKVFEFLEYDSLIAILPPNSSLMNFKSHIESLPEDEIFLSNLYKEMGTIDNDELILLLESFHGIITHMKATQSTPIVSNAGSPSSNSDKSKQLSQSSSLRVDSSRIDYLINKVGELVVTEATLSQLLSNSEDSALTESLNSTSRLIHEIREISLKLRMVPIGDSFQKYHRIVRDLGNELGKKVQLHIQGGDTELDKTVMERLSDPMVHLVRNAIDHGLETPDERQSYGKESVGNLHLNAYHDTGSIVIEIRDDGRGINHEKVLAKAREKGFAKQDEHYSNEEIERFLFHPGFSTADKVSNISGRGVGLDVVLKNIESLRGFIQVQSEKNKGSKFIIRLPLTLAIIDGFLVGSGPDLYVLPLDMVRECVEFREDLKSTEDSGRFFNLRGSILPYVRLDEFFHGIPSPSNRENIVITEFQGHRFGLVVDRLYGEFQTVIKPLAKVFENIRGIGGSTTLGDGKIALILDIPDLHFSLKEREQFHKKEIFVDN